MKEDILEQLVDDYYQAQGYFTRHNIKFKPSSTHPDYVKNQDDNHSDIDVVGFNPRESGAKRVVAVSCKSWQSGFRIESLLKALASKEGKHAGRVAWKSFRELVAPKWSEAFISAVENITGTKQFTYVTAVTFFGGDVGKWEKNPEFKASLGDNPIELLPLRKILIDLNTDQSTTMASSGIGRMLQLMRAAKKGNAALSKAVQEGPDEDLEE